MNTMMAFIMRKKLFKLLLTILSASAMFALSTSTALLSVCEVCSSRWYKKVSRSVRFISPNSDMLKFRMKVSSSPVEFPIMMKTMAMTSAAAMWIFDPC